MGELTKLTSAQASCIRAARSGGLRRLSIGFWAPLHTDVSRFTNATVQSLITHGFLMPTENVKFFITRVRLCVVQPHLTKAGPRYPDPTDPPEARDVGITTEGQPIVQCEKPPEDITVIWRNSKNGRECEFNGTSWVPRSKPE